MVKLQVRGNIPHLLLGDDSCQPAEIADVDLAIWPKASKDKIHEHSRVERALVWMIHNIARRGLFTPIGVKKFPQQKKAYNGVRRTVLAHHVLSTGSGRA